MHYDNRKHSTPTLWSHNHFSRNLYAPTYDEKNLSEARNLAMKEINTKISNSRKEIISKLLEPGVMQLDFERALESLQASYLMLRSILSLIGYKWNESDSKCFYDKSAILNRLKTELIHNPDLLPKFMAETLVFPKNSPLAKKEMLEKMVSLERNIGCESLDKILESRIEKLKHLQLRLAQSVESKRAAEKSFNNISSPQLEQPLHVETKKNKEALVEKQSDTVALEAIKVPGSSNNSKGSVTLILSMNNFPRHSVGNENLSNTGVGKKKKRMTL